MIELPRKPGPQLWEDVVLPIFDQPEPVKARERSKKQDDDASKVKWTRRPKNAKQVPCEDCVVEHPKGLRAGIGMASYVRSQAGVERYLCFHHKAERGFREDLAGEN